MSALVLYHEQIISGRDGKEVLRVHDEVAKEIALKGESVYCLVCKKKKNSIIYPFCKQCSEEYKNKGYYTSLSALASRAIESHDGKYENLASVAFDAMKQAFELNLQLIWVDGIVSFVYGAQESVKSALFQELYIDALEILEKNDQMKIKAMALENKERHKLGQELAELVNTERMAEGKYSSQNRMFGRRFMSMVKQATEKAIVDFIERSKKDEDIQAREEGKVVRIKG